MTEIFLVLSGLLFGLSFLQGIFVYLIPIAALCLVFAWLNRPKPIVLEEPLKQRVVPEEVENKFVKDSEKSVLDRHEKKKLQMETESEIDLYLFEAAKMWRNLNVKTHSVFIFFPGAKADDLFLRIYDSLSNKVISKVIINAKQGLIGSLLKDGVKRILEGDLGGTRLYTYAEELDIQSIAGVPVLVNGRPSGVIVVDSLEKEAYSNTTLKALQSFAQVVGQLTYRSYMDFEHLYQREQYKALLEYQKKFLHTMSVKDIFQHIESFICRTVPSDRLMIIIKEGDKGRIVRCNGINQSFYQNLEFSIEGKGLLSLCFLKNMEMQRSLRIGERVFRVSSDELYSDNFRSLAGIPVLNENGDAEIVLSVESQSLPIYSTHYLDLLRNIANVAGFALARVNAYEEKQNLASKDGLTGLYNHRTFQGILNQETIRARRMGSQLGIIMMDIDRFKSVNDTYGHPIGDQVLKNNANTILKEIRGEVDVLCRYGGEEFVVLIIDANEQIVKDTAERIRVAVQSQDVEIGRQEPLKITLSLGYALFPDHGDDFKIVLDKADKALYKAKTGGRNKVVGYK